MRSLCIAMFSFFMALPALTASAQQPVVVSSAGGCGCGVVAPVVAPACGTCNSCGPSAGAVDACGCSSCGRGLCSNWSAFYEKLYADFYAKNAWYVEHRQREAAARRARMLGKDDTVEPAKAAEPVKAK